MNNKVFFIIDGVMSSVVNAEDADAQKAYLVSLGKSTSFEIVSKEEFIARGFHYYEESAPKEFIHENESIDFSAFEEDED